MTSFEDQLESHPIDNNKQLIDFDVRSRHIFWHKLVKPLSIRGESRNLNDQFCTVYHSKNVHRSKKRDVLVCHDMMGNYLEDRFYSKSKKWDDYRFYHWAGIDYFCYFSHRYITIPPPGWINAAHLHGVRVLGTMITENDSGVRLLREVLSSKEYATETAKALVRLALHFNFEGWLINIECKVEMYQMETLVHFLQTLTEKMHQHIPESIVMWYDSVLYTSGQVAWQNEVNEKNVIFLKSCDAVLLNYAWNDDSLRHTQAIVKRECKDKMSKVFVGFDVFGRSKPGKFDTPNVVNQMLNYDFSIGLFAPAWTFESLNQTLNIKLPLGHDRVNEAFLERNESFWELLWKNFSTGSYKNLPLFTDFCLGSGKYAYKFGRIQKEQFFALCKQSLQPSVPLRDYIQRYFDDAFSGGSCLKIIRFNEMFRIFVTDFYIASTLVFAYVTKITPESAGQIDCSLHANDPSTGRKCDIICGNNDFTFEQGRIFLQPAEEGEHAAVLNFMYHAQTPLKLPFGIWNEWKVNYYVASFDKPINVTDIGVCLRMRRSDQNTTALLGAVYVHGGDSSVKQKTNVAVDMYFA